MAEEGSTSRVGEPATVSGRLVLEQEALVAFCRRWQVIELALFGSVLGTDFRGDSDVDVLVTFAPQAGHSLLDLVRMQHEFERLVGRRVDLVERRSLRNPFLRREILRSSRVLYAA